MLPQTSLIGLYISETTQATRSWSVCIHSVLAFSFVKSMFMSQVICSDLAQTRKRKLTTTEPYTFVQSPKTCSVYKRSLCRWPLTLLIKGGGILAFTYQASLCTSLKYIAAIIAANFLL